MAEQEEFHESDIIFSDAAEYDDDDNEDTVEDNGIFIHRRRRFISKKRRSRSVPVNIPVKFVLNCGDDDDDDDDEDHRDFDDDDDEEERSGSEIVPPHVIMGRRIAAKMALSVCIGNGRTLKGRDLSTVRNSILRLTGFLEP